MAIRFSGPCCCGCLYFKDLYARNSDNTAPDRVNFKDVDTYKFASGAWHVDFSGSGLICDVPNSEITFYNDSTNKKNSVIMANFVLNEFTDYGTVVYGNKEIKVEGLSSGVAQIKVDGTVVQELGGFTYPYSIPIKAQAMPNTVYPNVNRHLNHKYDSAVLQIWFGGSPTTYGGIGETSTCYSALLSDSEVSVAKYGIKASSGVRVTSIFAYNVPSGFTLGTSISGSDMDNDGIPNTGDMSWDQVGLCSFQPHTPSCWEGCFPDKLPNTITLTIGGWSGTSEGICRTPDAVTAASAISLCSSEASDALDACNAAHGGSCPCSELCNIAQTETQCRCDASTVNTVIGFDVSENNGTFVLSRLPRASGTNDCDSCTYQITGVPYTVPVVWSSATSANGDVTNETIIECGPAQTRTERFLTTRSFSVTLSVTYKDLYSGITDTTITCVSTSGFSAVGISTFNSTPKGTACGGGDFCIGSGTVTSSSSVGSGTIFCGTNNWGFPCSFDMGCPGANVKENGTYTITSYRSVTSNCRINL